MILLEGKQLENNNLDLYEILNASDILITDYSSVYFDYLLLNKPIIFTPTDLDEYINDRGYLLLPYADWICGPTATNQSDLQDEIVNNLNNNKLYEKERKELLIKTHRYIDNNSNIRVWRFIDSKL